MVQRLSVHRNITLDSTSANSSPEVCRSTTHLALKKHSLQESNVLRLQRSISAEPEKIVKHESYDGMFSFFFLDCLNMFQDTESILNISTKLNRHCVKSVQIRRFFWSVFSLIRNEYGEILHISLYSVRMWENTDQEKLRIWTLFTQWMTQKVDWREPFWYIQGICTKIRRTVLFFQIFLLMKLKFFLQIICK